MAENNLEITESEPTEPVKTLNIPLVFENEFLFEKLGKWAQRLGILHIVVGIILSLTIFVLALPLAASGIFMIFMGTKLNSSSAFLKYGIYHTDSENVMEAIDNIQSYMKLNFILYAIGSTFFIIIMIIALVFGTAINDFILEFGYDYTNLIRIFWG